MSEQSNVPMTTGAPEPFYQVWVRALTRPNEQTFAELAASPNAKAGTAYLWYFLGSIVQFILASLVQGAAMRQMMEQLDPSGAGQVSSGDVGSALIGALCGAPVGAIVATIVFAIFVFIMQWIAGMFGGRGNSEQLAYALSAVLTPALIVGGVLSLLSAIPYIGLCFSALSVVAGLYVLYLEVVAVKGVNQFGWGQALGTVFIPFLAVVFICGCLIVATFALLGPVVGDVFSEINQSLQNIQ